MWVLDVVSASSAASVDDCFYLKAGEWSIGRKKCHFNFQADASISRSHALLRVGALSAEQLKDPATQPSLVLVDCKSRFGSFVNDEQLIGERERELKQGDQITFGAKRTILRVRYQVFILVASRILKPNRARVYDTCQQIGIHLISHESKDATHCIMDPGGVVATVKALWALVFNQPVVTTPWIYAIQDRTNLSDPLPRCEDFLPTDESMPSVALNYQPNPMRKTLYQRHAIVFLMPQSMEQLVQAMDGIVVAAYADLDNDDALLRDLEQHASNRHVLIVEPLQDNGFSSTAGGTEDSRSQSSISHQAAERRVALFRSINATFTTIQELAASIIFVKAPIPTSECSFSSSLGSSAIPICSFPENLSLTVPSTSQSRDDIALESVEPKQEEQPPSPKHEEDQREDQSILSLGATYAADERPVKAKSDVTASTLFIKEEISVLRDDASHSTMFANAADPFEVHSVGQSQSGADQTDGSDSSNSWISTRARVPRQLKSSQGDQEDDEVVKALVVTCSLVLTDREQSARVRSHELNDGVVNFKRFKKGNGYASRSSASLFPKQTVVSVVVNNVEREEAEERLGVLEEQERIADELFAMVERRGATRRAL